MKKDFDFDDIGKRTPYRTPDGFFEDMQRRVMERAGVKQRRKSHLKLIVSAVVTMAAILAGFLFVPSLRQINDVKSTSSISGLKNCRMRSWKSSSASLKTIYF